MQKAEYIKFENTDITSLMSEIDMHLKEKWRDRTWEDITERITIRRHPQKVWTATVTLTKSEVQ